MNSYIRPLSHYLNKNNKNVFTEFNNNNVLLQQSPKLSSRKFRVFKTEENKNKSNKYIKNNLFSLNDINDKVTNKRGTDFPDSFKRYNYNELKKIITSSNENKIKNEEKIEENKQNNNNNNNKDYKRPNSAKNLNKKKLKINIENNNTKENNKNNENNNNKDIKIIYNTNKKAEELLIKYMINKKNDKFLPKNYNYYNTCLNNPILYNEMKNEQILKIAPKYKILNYNNIKNKINYSDIFFVKKENNNNINNNTFNNTNNKYLHSNIFNTKSITNFDIEKSSEKYLFNKTNLQKYSKISESKSDFIPYKINNINQLNTNNLTNEKYNIIAPNIKNYLDIVKKDIKNNNKIKGLSEFYDKTRKTSCNNNEDYQKAYKNNKFTFRKVHQMCGDFIESYNISKSLVNHPFKNK